MAAAELSIRAGAVALVLLLGVCGPATTMPSLKENVHAHTNATAYYTWRYRLL